MDKNILKHYYVPEHKKLSDEQKKEVLERFNVGLNQLPKILKKDPAVKDLNAEVGDLIEIKRNSQTSKDFFFYRVVVDG